MSKTRRFRRKQLTTIITTLVSTIMWSAASSGQSVANEGRDPTVESVVITGSRISRDGYDKPTPVSVLNDEDIKAEAAPSVADFVASLPSVRGSSNASSTSAGLSSGTAGIASLNLRSLGAGRSLVLLDGQRSVVSAATGQIDTNTFPQPLIERVEVVTGGASSAYGSDAISGVVNFILDRDFTGIETGVEYGETSYGDAENVKYNFTFGSPFADGRGHALFSAEHFDIEGIHNETRKWAERGYWAIINPDRTPGAPHYVLSEGVGLSAYTPGGLITAGPLRGTYFGEGGEVGQLNYGQVSGQWMLGGDWQYTNSGQIGTGSLAADEQRDSVFTRASWELTPNISVFAQASWAKYEGMSGYMNQEDRNITIQRDNAFLPEAVRQEMIARDLNTFTLATANVDFGFSGNTNERSTKRYVVGGDGEFDAFGKNWAWDTYYQRGVTDTDELLRPTFHTASLRLATDAVLHPSTGDVVCRSSIADPANGCVPINRFGTGVASADALAYVLDQPYREQRFTQDVAAINFTTNDFEGWAGPVSLAFGAEWRSEEMSGLVDPRFNTGWKFGNYLETHGKYSVKEVFVETVVPLVGTLEFNGAARYTDYSTSGEVSTWKAGLTYAPTEDITLRLTKSLDIRAPNMSEMFATGTARTNSTSINGQPVAFIENLMGNPNVKPEEADTIGAGIVLQPSFLPGAAASIDYYKIQVDGVIQSIHSQLVTDYCVIFGVPRYCNDMIYENGVLTRINTRPENLNRLQSRGVDYELSYTFDAADLPGDLPGEMSIRALLTNYLDNITDDGVTVTDSAGEHIGNTPDWVYRIVARYSFEDWMVNFTVRGVSDGVINSQFVECTSACPAIAPPMYTVNENDIKGRAYLDAYVSKNFMFMDSESEVFLSVKNVFDLDPVVLHDPNAQASVSRPGFQPTNRGLYDVLGRNFRVGVRMQF